MYAAKTQGVSRVKGVSKYRGSGRVRSLRFIISRVGSDRVGSRSFKISRVGSDWVNRLQNLAGRVGSGQEVSKSCLWVGSSQEGFKISRIGAGHDPRDTGHSWVKPNLTRKLFSGDLWVKPVDLARGFAFFKLSAEGCRCAGAPRVRPAYP